MADGRFPLFPAAGAVPSRTGNPFVSPWATLLDSSSRSVLALACDGLRIYERLANRQTTQMLSLTQLGIEQSCQALAVWGTLANRLRLQRPAIALVAGADCAEGQAVIEELVEAGYRVLGTHAPDFAGGSRCRAVSRRGSVDPVHWEECNLSDFDACLALSEKIAQDYGGIDVLVNCVGGSRRAVCVDDPGAVPVMQAILATELDRVFNVTRSFLDGMVARQYGRIVSVLPIDTVQRIRRVDAPARAGVIAFTRSLALALADADITVNCVSLGADSGSAVSAGPIAVPSRDWDWGDESDTVQRIAATVLSLVSASSSINGADVHIPPRTLM
jgi:acetoacetyl-CoA reductase